MTREEAMRNHPSAWEVWTPQDTAGVIAEWHRHTDQAVAIVADDRKPRWRSVSRWRRARIMDALAVALLIALMAAFGVIVWAASARADTTAELYATVYSSAVCHTLEKHPSTDGLQGIIEAIVGDGLTDYQAGEAAGIAIGERCPQYLYIAEAFVALHLAVKA